MTKNKKALLNESGTTNTFIIPQNPNTNKVLNNMPQVLSDVMQLLQENHINVSFNCLLNMLLVKTAQMITAKRVTLQEIKNIIIPNWYAIIFMSTGTGKDTVTRNLDNSIFKEFRSWFKNEASNYRLNKENAIIKTAENKFTGKNADKQKQSYIETETQKIRDIIIEMQDGTQEGFYSDARSFANADFGSLFLKLSEFGLYLKSNNIEKEMFLNCLYQAYDGTVVSKCIKGENRQQDVENIPVNALLYSNFRIFKQDVQKQFDSLMMCGLNRRSVISFYNLINRTADSLSYEDKEELTNNATSLDQKLHSIFLNITPSSCYKLTKEAYNNIFRTYQIFLNDLFNSLDDEILKDEALSRGLKSLKLSCLYACLNHPNELVINETDMKQAITTVQALSADLKAFLEYRPQKVDKYDKVYSFFKQHIEVKYNTVKLREALKPIVDLSRRNLDKEFPEIIQVVKDYAQEEGLTLIEEKIHNNSGTAYYLHDPNQSLTDNVIPLKNII